MTSRLFGKIKLRRIYICNVTWTENDALESRAFWKSLAGTKLKALIDAMIADRAVSGASPEFTRGMVALREGLYSLRAADEPTTEELAALQNQETTTFPD